MMLKFWFLASAVQEQSSGPPSATVESNAVEIPFSVDERGELVDDDTEFIQLGQTILKQPAYLLRK
jgi:hypothetical protein